MGRDLYENFPDAKALFDRANAYLGRNITDVMFYGTEVDDQFYAYLDMIKENIGMNGYLKEDIYPTVSDTVLTLSTRVKGKDDRRYLVQAKLIGRKKR